MRPLFSSSRTALAAFLVVAAAGAAWAEPLPALGDVGAVLDAVNAPYGDKGARAQIESVQGRQVNYLDIDYNRFTGAAPAAGEQTLSRLAVAEELANYVDLLAPEHKKEIIRQTAELMRKSFRQGDYPSVETMIQELLELDPVNGHALYFAGEVQRKTGREGKGHADFKRYLEVEKGLPDSERGGGADIKWCYAERTNGYCQQRTGWICHLMANDYYQKGLAEPALRLQHHASALGYAGCALQNYLEGFTQLKPTKDLAAELETELQAMP